MGKHGTRARRLALALGIVLLVTGGIALAQEQPAPGASPA